MHNKRAIALGYFDGLHIGHNAVISNVIDAKKSGYSPAILLFDEHPLKYIKDIDVPSIITDDDRNNLLVSNGLEIITFSFSEIASLSPEVFVKEILKEKLNAGFVSCGYNYSFGKNASGKTDDLIQLCKKYEIEAKVTEEVSVDNSPVSSTAIRDAIDKGNIIFANKLLGRKFSFESSVFSGDHRGRLLGFPTINQYLPAGLITPAFGVYATEVTFDNKTYIGVTNIGNRPTFDNSSVRSETFILDYSGNLYNKKVRISLLEFIRPEKKFSSVDELSEQINRDTQTVKQKYKNKTDID